MAKLTLVQTNSVTADGLFQIINTVTSPDASMTPAVFSFTSGSNTYDHISTIFDIQFYPTVPDPNKGFYRQSTVTMTFTSVTDAQSAASEVQSRVSALPAAYNSDVLNFVGTFTYPYSS